MVFGAVALICPIGLYQKGFTIKNRIFTGILAVALAIYIYLEPLLSWLNAF